MSTCLRLFSIWNKFKRWKSSVSGCLVSWLKKKKSSFWSVIFSYSMQQQRTISLSDCDVWCKGDCICQLAMTSSVAGPRSPKELPIAKSNLHQTKVTVSVWWSSARMNHHSFPHPGETFTSAKYVQQINEMHQKLQRLQTGLVNRKDRWHTGQPTLQKLNKLGFIVIWIFILHIHLISCQPTTTSSSTSITFCRKNIPMTSRMQKMLSKSSSNPEAQLFML